MANAQERVSVSSGDEELDRIRLEVANQPTNRDNFELRALKMKLWVVTLQQQGARLEAYLPIDAAFRKDIWWNTIDRNQGKPQQFTDEQMMRLTKAVDQGFAILDSVQNAFEVKSEPLIKSAAKTEIDASSQPEIPWTHYKGNEGLNGYTGAVGPTKGEMAWKFPVGLAWESQPKIEDGKVYLSSPGMRTIMYCLDLKTGKEIWNATQTVEIMGDQLYDTPNNQSTPVVLKDYVLFREMGARGNKGPTKEIVYINKKNGKIEKDVVAGHVDYRAGHAPFDANENFIVYTHGKQDIHEQPAVGQGFNHIVVRETKTGKKRWDYNVGFTFAEPKLDNNLIFVGTQTGYMYAFDATKFYWHGQQAMWKFRANGSINKKAETYGDYIMFGANDGLFYCLNKNTGELVWKYQTEKVEKRAFKHFSRPFAKDGKVVVGAANNQLYCFDINSGKLLFEYTADDYIRSQPVFVDDSFYFATLKGSFYGIQFKKGKVKELFKKHLAHHPIVSDLSFSDGVFVINDTDLYSYGVDLKGNVIWKKSLIQSFEKDGNRILSDQIAGGAYYQSKPTAQNNIVYFGSPLKFVYAVDSETGKEIWKFETGASISGAPTLYNGKVYIGQQGSEEEFYCLDAKTGELIWTQKTGWVWGSANASDGMVYVPCVDGYVMALDAETGAMIWRHRFGASVCSEPAIEGNQVVFGGWDNYSIAFDKKTGDVNWQFQGGGTDSGVGIIANGKLYTKNKCVDMKTGELIWKYVDGVSNFNTTPAYHDGKVYMSCWHGLGLGGICVEAVIYCIDAETGEKIWTHLGGGLSSPVIDDGNVYFPSIADPYFYCVDADGNGDGTTTCKWMYEMGNKVEESTPAIYKGKIYVMSSDGYIHAIK
jgi:outer membrane protein assembly factor BamB